MKTKTVTIPLNPIVPVEPNATLKDACKITSATPGDFILENKDFLSSILTPSQMSESVSAFYSALERGITHDEIVALIFSFCTAYHDSLILMQAKEAAEQMMAEHEMPVGKHSIN